MGAVITLPVIAKLTPRRAYVFGALLFMAGSSACATALNMAMFIIGRALQSLRDGLMSGMAFVMIPPVFPDALRSGAVALISSVWGPAALTGPFFGGALAGGGLWRTAFWTSVPIGFFLAMLAYTVLPTRSLAIDPEDGFLKGLGARLTLVTMAALALSVSSVPGRLSVSSLGVGGALAGRSARQIFLRGGFDIGTPMAPITYTMILLVLAVGTTSFIPYIFRVGLWRVSSRRWLCRVPIKPCVDTCLSFHRRGRSCSPSPPYSNCASDMPRRDAGVAEGLWRGICCSRLSAGRCSVRESV